MPTDRHILELLPGRFAALQLAPEAPIPDWCVDGVFSCITRTPEELSILCAEEGVPTEVPCRRGFRALRVRGPLDFSAIGVIASLAEPLARASVSLLAVSTYATDYVLVTETDLARAVAALRAAGHVVHDLPGPMA